MENELFEKLIQCMAQHKVEANSDQPTAFLKTLRQERRILTLLLETLSERVGTLLESEHVLKSKLLDEMTEEQISEKVSGKFTFRLESAPDKILYQQKLGACENVLSPLSLTSLPDKFVEKKSLHVLKRREFEKAILNGLQTPAAKKIQGKRFVKIISHTKNGVSSATANALDMINSL